MFIEIDDVNRNAYENLKTLKIYSTFSWLNFYFKKSANLMNELRPIE